MAIFEIRDLTVTDQDKEILHALSLEAPEGSYLTLTGASGSGKSTFLKVLATLQVYSAGQVFYKGQELQSLDPISYRREVSYCFQQPTLFGTTVKDNLAFPFDLRNLPFDKAKACEWLTKVNLSEDFLEQEIAKLSGGEKQRVALVRNLLFEPAVLLLDEVTTGLDAENKAIVRDLIQQVHQAGTTVLEVTHDKTDIAEAASLIRIENGSIQLDETGE